MRFILSVSLGLAACSFAAQAAPVTNATPESSWNQWWCQAHIDSYSRPHYFSGWSAPFAPGSGQGQQAHQTAYDYAIRHCNEYGHYYNVNCSCDFENDCWVEQHD